MDLRCYPPHEVPRMGQAILREVDAGTLDVAMTRIRLATFKFRDTNGSYWTFGPSSGQWYRFDGGRWQPKPPPTSALEAPTELNIWQSAPAKAPQGERPEPPHEPDAAAFVASLVARAREAYQSGERTSYVAEGAIAQTFLLDRDARFWTPGFHSGNWYAYASGRWARMPSPPTQDILVDYTGTTEPSKCATCGAASTGTKFCQSCGAPMEAAPAFSEAFELAVAEFILERTQDLPEPVAAPWTPPEEFAERVHQCPRCGIVVVGEQPACNRCGTSFAPAETRPTSGPSCGQDVAPGVRFCGHCGHVVATPPVRPPAAASTWTCSGCGNLLPNDKKFCTKCGAKRS